jgi:hypothetical protein
VVVPARPWDTGAHGVGEKNGEKQTCFFIFKKCIFFFF